MLNPNSIRVPVAEEMKKFEGYFSNVMKSKVPLLGIITNYIYRRKGKQIRPLLVFLTSGLNGGITNSTYVAASMIELLHTATLIHDDVVDEAYERRGSFSINALWRSKIAVLVGDFLLSKGLLVAIENDEFELLKHMSKAVKEMSEGELMQIERSRKMDIDEGIYFDIIRKKTATLLASCAVNGAQAANASAENLAKMYNFGENLGIAFQIKDDIFDYEPKGIIGKPTGNDIKENKLTLPIIHALSKVNNSEQLRVRKLLRKSKQNSKAVEEVISFTVAQGGVEYAKQKMQFYASESKKILATYPDSDYKESLNMLIDYITTRKK